MQNNKIASLKRFWDKFGGILVTLCAIGVVELYHSVIGSKSNQSPILILAVVLTALKWGIGQGIISAVLVSIYSTHLFYVITNNEFSRIAKDDIGGLAIISIVLALTVGIMSREQKRLAQTDALTGLSNRRYFFELATNELHRAQRYGKPISVAYIDVDNFKAINDSIGHSAGDALLRLVAQTIKNNIRKVDVPARLGGDEFALLLPEASPESALSTLQRLEKELMEIMHKNEWLVTFSIGVATFTSPPASIDEVINTADTLMYDAKHGGKNMIKQEIYPSQKVADGNVPSLPKHS